MKKYIYVIAALALAGVGLVYYMNIDKGVPEEEMPFNTEEQAVASPDFSETSTFTDLGIGMTFDYPTSWGEIYSTRELGPGLDVNLPEYLEAWGSNSHPLNEGKPSIMFWAYRGLSLDEYRNNGEYRILPEGEVMKLGDSEAVVDGWFTEKTYSSYSSSEVGCSADIVVGNGDVVVDISFSFHSKSRDVVEVYCNKWVEVANSIRLN